VKPPCEILSQSSNSLGAAIINDHDFKGIRIEGLLREGLSDALIGI
jgi:hypothetical protein